MRTLSRIWVLGAPDPEMEAIETLLRECGEQVAYALDGADRVRADRAYAGTSVRYATDCGEAGHTESWYLVECAVPVPDTSTVTRIDHHRPGDPGYGRPPSEFLSASSLGQVIAQLAHLDRLPETWPWGEVPRDLLLAAAADHCLGAAYRGECPGVDPETLMRHRATERARFQRRPTEDVLRDIEETSTALRAAPLVSLAIETRDYDRWGQIAEWSGCPAVEFTDHEITVRDMRREPPYPELVEAATRTDLAYISGPLVGPDGRCKYTCSGRAEHIQAFFAWAQRTGLVDAYGDPARGFAGAYAREGSLPLPQ